MIAVDILADGFFAAIAAMGFGAISDPPLRAFKYIAVLAAVGHAARYCLMTFLGVDIARGGHSFGLPGGGFHYWYRERVVRPQGVLSDDSAVHPGLAAHGPGYLCLQDCVLTYNVPAEHIFSDARERISAVDDVQRGCCLQCHIHACRGGDPSCVPAQGEGQLYDQRLKISVEYGNFLELDS